MRRLSVLLPAAMILLVANRVPPVVSAADELPGVPISKEHHHHLVLENSLVKAYEVEVVPHESTLMHQHLHDYLYIVFGDADFTNAVAGKQEARVKQPDLSVNLSRGPFAHIATNNADTPFRNITIELLRPQGEVKKFYPSINEALFGGPNGERDLGVATVLETEEVRVLAVGVRPKSKWSLPADGRPRLVVITNRMHDISAPKEENAPFPAGMLTWVSAGQAWSVSNESREIYKVMVVEFKSPAGK